MGKLIILLITSLVLLFTGSGYALSVDKNIRILDDVRFLQTAGLIGMDTSELVKAIGNPMHRHPESCEAPYLEDGEDEATMILGTVWEYEYAVDSLVANLSLCLIDNYAVSTDKRVIRVEGAVLHIRQDTTTDYLLIRNVVDGELDKEEQEDEFQFDSNAPELSL